MSDTPKPFHLPNATQTIDRRSHEIFAAAVSTTRMPMIVTDPRQHDNPIVFANNAFLIMTGYTEDEILGTNCRFLQGPDTDESTVDEVRNAVLANQEIATEILNYRKDGSTFWNALFISPIVNEAGEVIYFFASQLDVSRRRDAEDALRQAQKMESLGQLTGGIAHDFNNLLQVMSGYVELSRVGLEAGAGVARVGANLDRVKDSIDKASRLTQQLLAFARKQSLSGRVLSLNGLVEDIVTLSDRTLGEHVRIRNEYAPDLPNVRVDSTQMEVAMLNLLVNARDALADTPDATITVRTELVTVNHHQLLGFAELNEGQYVTVQVTDNGVGIPPAVVDRVVDPFFTTKELGKGTGLGLSMVYGFVKQSGGAMNIESEEGAGTTVTLYFPALDAEENPMPTPIKIIEPIGKERILVVDDRPEVADVGKALLDQLGYDAIVAYSPDDALAVLASDTPIDMLLTDVIMPGKMNGVMLAREARQLRPRIRILLTTGFADTELNRKGERASEFDILYKPYSRGDLSKKVKIVMKGPTGVG
ncbi:hybrid sensor histidine kinase/response regulator [Pigmentiphaga litoralis]|uniref:histidine kinase famiy protein n=1 Tax=Pigmentiphaga litoralis TaxID=516702 RepID=UPI0016753022|nr:histidine kinase famiy protein [Pigmentiphaga litoralis]GGX30832.1 hybrid sensor histidine kinase/response regulator [Pigmentiphaga litoralis]